MAYKPESLNKEEALGINEPASYKNYGENDFVEFTTQNTSSYKSFLDTDGVTDNCRKEINECDVEDFEKMLLKKYYCEWKNNIDYTACVVGNLDIISAEREWR